MRALLGTTLLAAALVAGCGVDGQERTFACERGLRSADWRDTQLKTAQSIERCGWIGGWQEERVLRALGPPTARNGRLLTWDLGESRRGFPANWFLAVDLRRAHGPVERATTYTRGV